MSWKVMKMLVTYIYDMQHVSFPQHLLPFIRDKAQELAFMIFKSACVFPDCVIYYAIFSIMFRCLSCLSCPFFPSCLSCLSSPYVYLMISLFPYILHWHKS